MLCLLSQDWKHNFFLMTTSPSHEGWVECLPVALTVCVCIRLAVLQGEKLSAEGGRGAPQGQIQLHNPDLWRLQRTRVLLHCDRVYEQWLPGPAAARGIQEWNTKLIPRLNSVRSEETRTPADGPSETFCSSCSTGLFLHWRSSLQPSKSETWFSCVFQNFDVTA